MEKLPDKLTVADIQSFKTKGSSANEVVFERQSATDLNFPVGSSLPLVDSTEFVDKLQKKYDLLQSRNFRLNKRITELENDIESIRFWQKASAVVGICMVLTAAYKSKDRR